MRQIRDEQGRLWEAEYREALVAHRKHGAVLAFRLAEPPAITVLSTIEFNSPRAAELAIRAMSEKELHRRLEWAMTDAGIE